MKSHYAKVVAALLVINSDHQCNRWIARWLAMAAMVSACCGPAQQIRYNYVNHSRGFFTGDCVRVAPLSTKDEAPKPVLVYLAFVDGTYNHPVQIAPSDGSKDNDSKNNTSWLINSLLEARLRTTNSPARIIDHFDPVPQTEEFKLAVVGELQKIFQEYQITFTLKRPWPTTNPSDYTMVVIGKRANDLADFSVRSYAPWDPGNKFHNEVAFVFNRGLHPLTDAIEIAHAIGHTFGLQDVGIPGFIMSHSGSAWADKDIPVPNAFEMYGRKREDPCHGSVPKEDTITYQNDKMLLARAIPIRPRPVNPQIELSLFKLRTTLCATSRDNSIKLRPPKVDEYEISEDGTITKSSGLVAYTDYRMWKPGDRIYVQINDEPKLSHLHEFIHERIRKYAKMWEIYANIKFEFDKPPGKDEKNIIIIGFDSLQSNHSYVGREITVNPSKTPTMNFNTFYHHRLYNMYPQHFEDGYRMAILHEFGHSLGLVHEHQSPLNEVKWNADTLYKYYGKEEADKNFLKIPDKKHVNYTKYDPLSIMHYSYSARSTTDGTSAQQNYDLSEMDKEGIRMIYPRYKNPRGILVPDPCDQLQFQIDYGAFGGDTTIFVLIFARAKAGETRLSKWKAIGIPTRNGEHKLSIEGDRTVWVKTFDFDELKLNRKAITFWKKSPIGTEVRLPYSWALGHALKPGCRVTFTWIQDSCN